MANRILLGKASTARGGSTKYGLWVSKPGEDVTTCSDDKLLFNTDKGAGGDIKSLFQVLRPVSNQTTVAVSNSFSGTANQSQNFDFDTCNSTRCTVWVNNNEGGKCHGGNSDGPHFKGTLEKPLEVNNYYYKNCGNIRNYENN